ncbi:hypothetical protein ASD11_06670 [Aeromicrobium sp. Root495]|uniref:maleylpyruvate isomerase N-terminal domain-containing protein n=1 Tax=Aeromicrobium sp. Root495 TaxID=1736550 RepID=UPI0006F9EE0C|nr:maleylpyruvate isomerase N-terminal domain-containing protein [Aeromicrobium sp. Root495]KQY59257.1 hypothetical protein ASD11_06670 [Aeromicrobium sp. Root495]
MTSRDQDLLAAAAVAGTLLHRPEISSCWDAPSVLDQMSVGMLACHLARQASHVAALLDPSTAGGGEGSVVLPEAADHYRRAAWVSATDLDDSALDPSSDAEDAAQGSDAMLARWDAALADVRHVLERGTARDVADLPWQGWSLRRPDFLLTRMVELVTHTDDLARSVDVLTPDFPSDVYTPVVHLLTTLAVERHGQAAMTSALTRRERMPSTISAF